MWHLKAALSFFLLMCATLGLGGSAGAVSIVTNGGFETGSFTGWTQTGNTTFNGVQCPGPGPTVHGGNCSAFFGPIGSTGGISQTLVTIPVRATTSPLLSCPTEALRAASAHLSTALHC